MNTTATTVGGSPAFAVAYTRDALGRIGDQTQTVLGVTRTDAYSYDLAGRLTAVTRNGAPLVSYTYDANGNRLTATTAAGTVTGTYDAQDRLVTYAGVTYTYTAAGELLTRTDPATGTTTYAYDVLGNLRQVALADGTVVSYVVDGANRRIARRVNGVPAQAFLYQGQLRPVAELDGAGAIVSRFVYGTGANVPEYLVRGGTTYRLVMDHLGSVRLVVNTATGAVAQQLDYDPFGRVVLDTNPGFQPFAFAGGLHDPLTGLIRFGARDYNAETGRWTIKDPVLFRGGDPNLFSYVLDDPMNLTDPEGLACKTLWQLTAENSQMTNRVLPGLLAPTGLSMALRAGQTVATTLETTTLASWALSGFRGATLAGASFTAMETGALAAFTSALGFALTGAAFEAGVGIGSMISAGLTPCEEARR